MKKLIIISSLIVAGFAANAASFTWGVTGLRDSSNTGTRWQGEVTLYCVEIASFSQTATTTNTGKISAETATTTFSDDAFVAGSSYSFYFKIIDGENVFESSAKSYSAQANATVVVDFGSYGDATQTFSTVSGTKDAWVQNVPEPTSGLLLLLGMAGLALRRKKA